MKVDEESRHQLASRAPWLIARRLLQPLLQSPSFTLVGFVTRITVAVPASSTTKDDDRTLATVRGR